MNISRRGKIARLPDAIRRQLNQHLRNGEAGAVMVNWWNSLPEVQAVLAAEFGAKPVREQNLSQWRQGAAFKLLRERLAETPSPPHPG